MMSPDLGVLALAFLTTFSALALLMGLSVAVVILSSGRSR